MSSRTADYTIKGFLYQFNLTLLKILESDDYEEIMVEGIIEDIDIKKEDKINAIQCKYHETKGKYILSDIYKPILQMMVHYLNNEDKDISYTLYAYFSEEDNRTINLSKEDLEEVFNTKNKDYIAKYIAKIIPPKDQCICKLISKESKKSEEKKSIAEYYEKNISNLECTIDLEKFSQKFELILGDKFEILCDKAKGKLRGSELSKEDVDDLFYPNSVQEIADISIRHNEDDRVVRKVDFLEKIKDKKTTAITRWTRELQSYRTFMKKRREQIAPKLKNNSIIINFILDAEIISGFNEEIIKFIDDYNQKYNFKIDLHRAPMFCLDGLKKIGADIKDYERRLYEKSILYENGIRGDKFFKSAFLREPKKKFEKKGESWKEFQVRISEYNNETEECINMSKPHVLFIVSNKTYSNLDTQDICVEQLTIKNFKELKYLLKITDNLE